MGVGTRARSGRTPRPIRQRARWRSGLGLATLSSSMSGAPPYTVEARVGRLIEARVFLLETVDDVDAYIRVLAAAVARLEDGALGVLCADHRPAEIYTQAVTDRLVESFQIMNSRLSRVAIITGVRKPTLYMQLRRITREAAYEARQVFQIPEPGLTHLGSALTPAERMRAAEFLADFTER